MGAVRGELSRLSGLLRAAPGTLVYLVSLLVTQLTLNTVDERIGRRVLLSESTNLHNMAHAPVQVLLGSAFWVDTSPLLTYLSFVALVLVMVPVERWVGTWRWLVTVLCGHVGATLATLLVTAALLARHELRPSIATISDVGVSYGLVAAAGLLTYRLPRGRVRWAWVGVLLAGLAVALVVHHQIADLGHVCAFAIGLALRPLVRRTAAPAAAVADASTVAVLSSNAGEATVTCPPEEMSDGVPRRVVVAGAGAGVAALGAAATLAGCSAPDGPAPAASAPPPTGPVPLGPVTAVPVGGGVVYPAHRVVVTQPTAGRFHGLSAVCTHQGCLVNDVSGGTINCPCHGSQFTLDGAVANGPADAPLPSRPVTVTDGKIVLDRSERS